MTPIQTPTNWPRLCASLALSVCLALTSTTASTAFAQTTPAAITGSFSAPVAPLLADGKPGFWVAPATIPLSATISPSSGNKITEVQFYADSTLIASMTAASDANGSTYKTTWQSVAANSYTLTVKAKDDKGNSYASAPVNLNVITNNAPQISLTVSPNSATAPATLILSAKASDTDGSISQVEFYNGTNKLTSQSQAGSDGNYRYNWSNVSAGTYNLSAKATDNLGSTTISNAQSVKVASGQAQLYDIHTDQLGTPRVITDGSGQEVWRWDSAPFGETAPNENPTGKGKFEFNLRFPGQYYDKETGLHYNYFRDYDPQTGRYVQSDPIGLGGGINTYGYVGGNPVSFFDSRGLTKKDLDFILNQVITTFPDIKPNGSLELGSVPDGAVGTTSKWSGNIVMATEFSEKKCFSKREWEWVFWTLFHEGMHSTDGWWRRRTTTNDDDDAHHNSIYNRENLEREGAKQYPLYPVWGKVRAKRADMDGLYKQYVKNSPDCCGK